MFQLGMFKFANNFFTEEGRLEYIVGSLHNMNFPLGMTVHRLCFLFAFPRVECRSRPSARPGTTDERLSCRAGGRGWAERMLDSFLFPRTEDFQSKGALGEEGRCHHGCAEARLLPLSRGECIWRSVQRRGPQRVGPGHSSRDRDPGPAGPLWPLINTGPPFVICSSISLDLLSVSAH